MAVRSVVQLVLSAVDRGLENTVGRLNKSLFSMKSLVVGVSAGLAGLFAGTATAGFFKDAADSAQNLEQELGTLRGVIEATGGAAGVSAEDIDRFARELDEATLGSASAIRQAAGVLLTFKSIAGDTFFDTLTLAQDMAEVFKQDVRGSVTQLAKALEDPIKGISALTRVGVTFNDQQKEQIKTLVQSNKLLEAQGIILDTLRGQVGGAASAAGAGLAGALDLVGKRFTDLKEQIGAAIIPAANGFFLSLAENIGAINKRITEFASSGELAKLAEAVAGVFKEGAAAVKDFILSVDLSAVTEKVRTFGGDVRETLTNIGESAGAVGDLLTVSFNGFLATINGAIAGVAKTIEFFQERQLKGLNTQIEQLTQRLANATEQQQQSILRGIEVLTRQQKELEASVTDWSVAAVDAAGRSTEGFNLASGAIESFRARMSALGASQEKAAASATALAVSEGNVADKTAAAASAVRENTEASEENAKAIGLRKAELEKLGITETEEIKRVEQLAGILEKDRQAREASRQAAIAQADATEKAAQAQQQVTEEVDRTSQAAGSLNDIISFVLNSLRKSSQQALNNFLGIKDSLIDTSTEAATLQQRLDSLLKTIRFNKGVFVIDDAFSRFVDKFHQTQRLFLETAVVVQRLKDNLTEAFESGRIGSINLSNAAATAESALQQMDGSQLEPLRNIIDAIRGKLAAMRDEILESVQATEIELARVQGNQREADLLQLRADIAEKIAKNEEQLDAARKARQQDLVAQLVEQRRQLQEIQKLREREINNRERPGTTTTAAGGGGGGLVGAGGGGGGIVIERGAFQFSGLDDVSLDRAARGLADRLDRLGRLRQ